MPYSVDGSLMAQWCLTSQAKLIALPLEAAKAQQHAADNYFSCLLYSKGIECFSAVNVKRQ